jgi:hypothetical protein
MPVMAATLLSKCRTFHSACFCTAFLWKRSSLSGIVGHSESAAGTTVYAPAIGIVDGVRIIVLCRSSHPGAGTVPTGYFRDFGRKLFRSEIFSARFPSILISSKMNRPQGNIRRYQWRVDQSSKLVREFSPSSPPNHALAVLLAETVEVYLLPCLARSHGQTQSERERRGCPSKKNLISVIVTR